ncbi:hypothetical protein OJF2_21540 [Aquisphaera giovannonii]|uniref:SHOCT domain-containing protein n=1 Tax=Aquisphaera giovannonii TaxID=406548 RepID=A0A5B9W132_9BACT|nr:hypothetical protein [Aquisphaera giovannonii]QEH33650.1 hypothetical protein OJF2_21540 [Aquisphaera giovannonii]
MVNWLKGAGLGSPAYYYGGLVLLVAALIYGLIVAKRAWEEAHEDLEPASLDELLEDLDEAHAAGELDEGEFARVKEALGKHSPPPGSSSSRS